jgi:hypothetical protein
MAQITTTAQASTKVNARPAACKALFAMDAKSARVPLALLMPHAILLFDP